MEWSNLQNAIFNSVAPVPARHTVVIARAGCAKTTTLVEVTKRLRGRVLVCAFNRSICDELQGRLPKDKTPYGKQRVTPKTLHGLGRSALMSHWDLNESTPDSMRQSKLIDDVLGGRDKPLRKALAAAIALAMNTLVDDARGLETLVLEHPNAGLASQWIHEHGRMDGNSVEAATAKFIGWIQEVLRRSLEPTPNMSFDDMIYVPAKLGLSTGNYDVVCVDEAQDLNLAQFALIRNAMHTTRGRLIAFGDPCQAIYGWRGAHGDMLAHITETLDAVELPLSRTYRCGKQIVRLAQAFVPDFEAAETNSEGVVDFVGDAQLYEEARPGDLVVSRVNAPLARIFVQLIRRKRPVAILGRDISTPLTELVEQSRCRTLPDFRSWIHQWHQKRVDSLKAQDREDEIEEVTDQKAMLLELAMDLDAMEELQARISQMAVDAVDPKKVTLASTHKAKGLEFDRVWMLEQTYRPEGDTEDQNLYYVAATRARTTLFMVQDTSRKVDSFAETYLEKRNNDH